MFGLGMGTDQNVVNEDKYGSPQQSFESVSHQPLECRRSVCKAERHYVKFVRSVFCNKAVFVRDSLSMAVCQKPEAAPLHPPIESSSSSIWGSGYVSLIVFAFSFR